MTMCSNRLEARRLTVRDFLQSKRFRRALVILGGLLTLLGLWEWQVCTPASAPAFRLLFPDHSVSCDGTPFFLYSKPSEILRTAVQTNILGARLLGHSLVTLGNSLAALSLTVVVCCCWYYFACRWKSVKQAGYTMAWLLQVIPYVAIAWILASIFDPVHKIIFGFVVASFPMFGALKDAIKKIPERDQEVLKLYGPPHRLRFRHLFAPYAAPEFFTGFALAAPLSVVGVLIADFTGGEPAGLGQDILIASRNVRASELWLATLLAICISCLLTFLVSVSECLFAKFNPWYIREIDDE